MRRLRAGARRSLPRWLYLPSNSARPTVGWTIGARTDAIGGEFCLGGPSVVATRASAANRSTYAAGIAKPDRCRTAISVVDKWRRAARQHQCARGGRCRGAQLSGAQVSVGRVETSRTASTGDLGSAATRTPVSRFPPSPAACKADLSASCRKVDLLACRGADFRHDLRVRQTRDVTQAFCQR